MNKQYILYISKMKSLQSRDIDNTGVVHKHHIIPKFMGGNDLASNLVKLTVEEHVNAHLELANCFPRGSAKRNKNLCSANVTKVWVDKGDYIDVSGENNSMWGKCHSRKTKKKIGLKSSMKIFNKEYREKLSKATSGKNNPMWGKKHSLKTRKKISAAQRGKKHHLYGTTRNTEIRRKIGLSQPTRRCVSKCDTMGNVIETYDSFGIAAMANNIKPSNLSTYFKKGNITKLGKQRTLGGYIWKLYEPEKVRS